MRTRLSLRSTSVIASLLERDMVAQVNEDKIECSVQKNLQMVCRNLFEYHKLRTQKKCWRGMLMVGLCWEARPSKN